jgi:hypothetical protein
MRRLLLPLLATAFAFAGCGTDEATPAAGGNGQLAQLVVRVDADGGKGAAARELRLNCAKPTDSPACGAAAGVSAADLAPAKSDIACTQLYGGPETATIKGTLRGDPVNASFSRTDGCQISRWKRVEALLSEVR